LSTKHFKVVRYFGLYARRCKAKYQEVMEKLHRFAQKTVSRFSWRQNMKRLTGEDPFSCPRCGYEMVVFQITYPDILRVESSRPLEDLIGYSTAAFSRTSRPVLRRWLSTKACSCLCLTVLQSLLSNSYPCALRDARDLKAVSEANFLVAEQTPFPGAESKIPIAVMDLTPRGLSADEVRTLSDRFRVELMLTERFDVMTREQMDRIFEEQRFQLSGFCDDEVCLVEIGKLIGVRKMVAGSIGKVGRLYSVSVWMVDVETGRMRRPCKADLGKVEGLQAKVMSRLARCLAELASSPKNPSSRSGGFGRRSVEWLLGES
jgi:hypothetical protein